MEEQGTCLFAIDHDPPRVRVRGQLNLNVVERGFRPLRTATKLTETSRSSTATSRKCLRQSSYWFSINALAPRISGSWTISLRIAESRRCDGKAKFGQGFLAKIHFDRQPGGGTLPLMKNLFSKEVPKLVRDALKHLLDEKHLYQYVEVKLDPLIPEAKRIKDTYPPSAIFSTMGLPQPPGPVTIEDILASCGQVPWLFFGARYSAGCMIHVEFELPSINTFCAKCKTQPPFNPVPDMCSFALETEGNQDQWYTLAYQCQQCHGTPVRFLVRREKLKLRLCGRDPIEAIPPPKELPDAHSEYYGKAIVAHNTKQTLAGIFFLRTFIEQFWRSQPRVQALIQQRLIQQKPRASGDEQGQTYQATVPNNIKNELPSLREIYGKLSAAMHDAEEDATLFKESCDKITQHFQIRSALKLTSPIFLTEDILDLATLVNKLRQSSDPVSAFLWQKLSIPNQAILTNYQPAPPSPSPAPPAQACEVIVQTLNTVSAGQCIFDPARFKGSLRPETSDLLKQSQQVKQGPPFPKLVLLNRRLLEEAYPDELARTIEV